MNHLKSFLDKPKGRKQAAVIAGSVVALTVVGLSAGPAFAHGSSDDPMSRVLGCKLAGVTETPVGDTEYEGCNMAYDIAGSFQFDEWMGIVVGDTRLGQKDAQYRTVAPDGQLCAAGNAKFAGLDAPSDDWPTTDLPGGEDYTLNFKNTVAHNPYTFNYYVTKDGYDPKQPLTWNDLESTPFLVADNVASIDQSTPDMRTELPVLLPEKSGQHVIYTIWQGNIKPDGSVQSNEAFFACSNVNFG
ncbi:lytic polysaccharide monooxygenase auxiliary activity family 9 protein [Plantibacter sp. YIM 135347]|uniref:lytic polysaccharide monooxygenase auxiliary activity family 9 protein n=1 Tax=Plantibacter sp. YIM 135347 TaxID=3423919 RepID=UPI003D32A09B